jgi:hypothetical protein
MWKYSTIAIVLAVLAFCIALYVRYSKEGFTDGLVPTADAESAAPGATTVNPTTPTGQGVDIQAAIESIRIFNDMMNSYKTNAAVTVAAQTQTELNRVAQSAADFLAKTDAERSAMSLADIQALRVDVEAATNTLRGVLGTTDAPTETVPALQPISTTAVTPASQTGLTLETLKTLRTRIAAEVARLEALRTSDATTLARITQLQKLAADIAEYIDRIERGQLTLEDVPIRADAAEAFLAAFEHTEQTLPALLTPDAHAAAPPSVSAASAAGYTESELALAQQMLEAARDLKWKFKVGVEIENDPAVAQGKEILARLDAIETRLNAVAISGKALSAKEVQDIKQQFSNLYEMAGGDSSPRPRARPVAATEYTRARTSGSAAEYPSAAAVAAAQGSGFGPDGTSFPHGEISSDIWIRPGFLMNDATIAHRASASAFDPATVGGADYKQRAADLCRQVKSAQLGDPVDFGCIAQPDTVSADYSWKGNYEMVCNRLGYTWGAWYPEMFGCPKQDPTAHFKSN